MMAEDESKHERVQCHDCGETYCTCHEAAEHGKGVCVPND